jgi:hypothetical protein
MLTLQIYHFIISPISGLHCFPKMFQLEKVTYFATLSNAQNLDLNFQMHLGCQTFSCSDNTTEAERL